MLDRRQRKPGVILEDRGTHQWRVTAVILTRQGAAVSRAAHALSDDVYTLARYLLRYHGRAGMRAGIVSARAAPFRNRSRAAIKPWRLPSCANVCRGAFARKSSGFHYMINS